VTQAELQPVWPSCANVEQAFRRDHHCPPGSTQSAGQLDVVRDPASDLIAMMVQARDGLPRHATAMCAASVRVVSSNRCAIDADLRNCAPAEAGGQAGGRSGGQADRRSGALERKKTGEPERIPPLRAVPGDDLWVSCAGARIRVGCGRATRGSPALRRGQWRPVAG
jgi:hypothetical protein